MSDVKDEQKPSSSRRVAVVFAVIAVIVICALVAGLLVWKGHGSPDERPPKPYEGARIELSLGSVPGHVRIGLVVSHTENPRQGGEWIGNAHGAQVAMWRLAQGGHGIEIQVVSDKGSSQGAKDAVESLKRAGVTGIVAATSGSHTDALAKEASRAGIPIIFPYATAPDNAPEGTWFGIPTMSQQEDLINAQAAELGCRRFAVHGSGLQDADTTEIAVDGRGQVTKQFVENLAKNPKTCVYIEDLGTAKTATNTPTMVTTLRAGGVTAPIFLGPNATSAVSTMALVRDGAAPTQIYSVGMPSHGVQAVSADGNEQARAFSEALSHLSTSEEKSAVDPSKSFETYSGEADGRSHDAVVALVAASVKADSNKAGEVRTALSNLDMSKLPLVNRSDAPDREASSNGPAAQMVQLTTVQGAATWVSAMK